MVGRRGATVARTLAAAGVALLFLLPLVFMLLGSLRTPGLPPPLGAADLVPDRLELDNYERAFELVDLARATFNSAIVAALAVPLSVLFGSWAGFAISRLPPRSANLIVGCSLVALMVPTTALLVPRFTLFRELGLVDTYVPLLAPTLLGMSPLYVLVYWLSFARLPGELFDAARLEGVTPFGAWRRIAMPLVRPATAAVAVLAFITSWSSFFEPLVYLFDADLYTLPLRLRQLAQLDRSDYPLLLAGAVVATIPVLLAFSAAQRFFLGDHRDAAWRTGE